MWIISYWIFPVISACMWIAMLVAMLGRWGAEGTPHIPNMSRGQTIAFISDIGAGGLKPLFIAGSTVTVVFLDLAFLSERWLRHSGRLARNKGFFDKFCSVASIFFSIAGALGLILLSIFDTVHHPRLHDGFLIMFMVGYLISAIFICLEYLRLGVVYRRLHIVLFVSFWIKLGFIVTEVALAIAFGVLMKHTRRQNSAAVLEWVIALIFTFYILSFVIDLLPAVRTRRHVPQGEKVIQMTQATPSSTTGTLPPALGRQQDVEYEQPLTTDSMGENANTYRGLVVNGRPVDGTGQPEPRRTMEEV